ncbi:RepFIB replication protein A [Vibrio maritimus]|uniref:RepFIB replication protein A n=1 Tax=Vibrio maritimus TaxID=990268 RepID=A0A090S649_9VIBR|nr:RepFIB replication protein A [Vibrio maritimus]
MKTDFRVWCACLEVFSRYGLHSDKVQVSFKEFADMCGYPKSRMSKALRKTVDESLSRLGSKRLSMKKKLADEKTKLKSTNTGLVLKSYIDEENDVVVLQGDPDIWELYQIDTTILISKMIIKELGSSESAQALYLYFASMTKDPYPISLDRMAERLRLNMPVKEQRRAIRKAIGRLEDLGYLTGEYMEWYGKPAYKIRSRSIHSVSKKLEEALNPPPTA